MSRVIRTISRFNPRLSHEDCRDIFVMTGGIIGSGIGSFMVYEIFKGNREITSLPVKIGIGVPIIIVSAACGMLSGFYYVLSIPATAAVYLIHRYT
jgi:hypothetical protein